MHSSPHATARFLWTRSLVQPVRLAAPSYYAVTHGAIVGCRPASDLPRVDPAGESGPVSGWPQERDSVLVFTSTETAMFCHVVYFWMKDGLRDDERKKFVERLPIFSFFF